MSIIAALWSLQLHTGCRRSLPERVRGAWRLEYRLDTAVMCRRAATYADKLLKGAKPGDLPIERFDKPYLAVNLKTAVALGLTLPSLVLVQANEVIR